MFRNCFKLNKKSVITNRWFGYNPKFYSAQQMFQIPDDHRAVQSVARQFAENELKPIAAELDRLHKFPEKQIRELSKLGLLAITVSPEYNGSGYDTLALALAVEEIARCCGGTGAIVSVHNCLYADLLDKVATEAQKQEFLTPFCTDGGTLGCFALSEPDAGSDVSAMSTVAELSQCGEFYTLTGTKSWVTSGREGGAAVVFATVDRAQGWRGISAFIVPIPSEGLTLGKAEDKMGIRASSTCNLILDGVRVPKKNVLGKIGGGFKIAMRQLDKARIGIAAQALGIGQAALELGIEYSGQRKAFGKPINNLQAVKLHISDMALELDAARLLVHRAAVLCDNPQLTRTTKYTSMAKVAASEAATSCAHHTIQLLGGMGYVSDMPAERYYRDARITEIYGGVNDVHKILVGDSTIKEYSS